MGLNDTEMPIAANFVPKQEAREESEVSLELNESIQIDCPQRLFKRHDSLAELSCVTATQKEALEREDSMNSDNSLICSQGFEISEVTAGESVIEQCAIQGQNFINSTPTKLPELDNNDPLTPTANLKILMSVVSPAIRDLEEKRKDLCLSDEVASNVVEEVVIGKPVTYSRKDKSLGLLCHRFLEKFPDHPEQPIEICLDEVSRELQVERRRVYDIVNVLESVEILTRIAKNRYLWYGKTRIAQTLGKLKVLSRSNMSEPRKKQMKNTEQFGKGKMKRSFSSGDMPMAWNPGSHASAMKDETLTKEEERQKMKAIIESTDYCRKEKSLGVLSQKFLIMFLISKGGVVTLDDAANVLLDETDDGNVKYKTKVRRLYDIANILTSLNFIEKVHIRSANGKKPGFKWIGDDIETLPENEMVTGPVMTFKTKHSLLPEPSPFVDPTFALPHPAKQEMLPAEESCVRDSDVRWAKSMSCGARFPDWSKPSTSFVKTEQKSACSQDAAAAAAAVSDGFPVKEFDTSPVEAGLAPCSPTEAAFLEDLRKLRAKYPNRMSQLLAALPFNQPTSKTSRRNLFKQSKSSIKSRRVGEPSPKKFKTAEVDSECIPNENIENQDPESMDNQMKFMHSTDSPFQLMPQTCDGDNSGSGTVLCERQRDNAQTVVGNIGCCPINGPPRTIKLVDQAVSPIAPGKLAPARASVAIQASLIKNLSPLKPLMCARQRVPSPWTIRASSPAPPIPPPSTPELPGELLSVPFQSQANAVYLRSVSPYTIPASQSCGSSPVTPFTGVKQVFPCSTTANVIISPGNLLYQMNQAMTGSRMVSPTIHSHSCPPSVNPSPISLENTSTSSSPGVTTTLVQPNNFVVNLNPVILPQQILPAPLTPLVNTTPVTDKEPTACLKLPCEASNTGNGLGETPSSNPNESMKDNVSRRLCLVNENS